MLENKKMVDGKGGSQKPSTTMLTERNRRGRSSLRSWEWEQWMGKEGRKQPPTAL